jgi:hypothetical protein
MVGIEIFPLIVTAENIEEKIQELINKHNNCELNKGYDPWVPSLSQQLETITKKWSDPESDGSASLFYVWYEKIDAPVV